jgi:hypothetical protein
VTIGLQLSAVDERKPKPTMIFDGLQSAELVGAIDGIR